MTAVSRTRLRSAWTHVGVLVLFVLVTIAVRGRTISDWTWINPDEAELMAQARAAQHSILPFTTWTMGTTGPWWPMFLAVLGALGYPLTLVSAHLLAAIFVGLMGFLAWVLMSRQWGVRWGLMFAVLWWLPMALIYPVGTRTNFGALSTELLPSVLVLASALVRPQRLAARPVLYVIPGLLGGLAVGSKYQVLPLVLALLWVQLREARAPRVVAVKALAWWTAAAATPFAVLAIALLVSPSVSARLASENVSFLGSYADGVSIADRLANSLTVFSHQVYLIVVVIFLIRLVQLSSRRVAVSRAILVASALAAIVAGGMGFGHYLWLVYTACALAASLPVEGNREMIPWPAVRRVVVPAMAAAIVAALAAGVAFGGLRLTSPASLADALRRDSVPRNAAVAALCPAGSDAMVWGWAPELYVYYSWHNTVPFMNTLGLRASAASYDAGTPAVQRGISQADCVIDATGKPFFDPDPTGALVLVYPDVAATLEGDFVAHRGVLNCESCVLYVRD
jgi:hypothetical protein